MVAITHDISNVAKLISYHENKVSLGTSQCLYAGNMPLSADDLSQEQKTHYMLNRCTLNANIKLPCLHVILGFHPLDGHLSNNQYSSIAKRYMDLIEFSNQPYLVYRHTDTFHPHLHIVSTNIRSDGGQIYTHGLGRRLSFPAASKLEVEFNLIPAQGQGHVQKDSQRHTRKLIHADQPTLQGIKNVLTFLKENYHFSNALEWNALLQPFNIKAIRPKNWECDIKKSWMYYIVDQRNVIISKGIPERKLFPELPLSTQISQKLQPNQSTSISRIRFIFSQLSHGLYQNKSDLTEKLLSQGIEVIEFKGTNQAPARIVILDHHLKCSLEEARLDLDFPIKTLLQGTHQHLGLDNHHNMKIYQSKTNSI